MNKNNYKAFLQEKQGITCSFQGLPTQVVCHCRGDVAGLVTLVANLFGLAA
ncbi:hypothetical protein [Ktedonospora formicarum]|uniref:Uncharacterized protein n=1 Tax=Ktedonospora formicarum TaxID=2778364 RepID=A0A8J3IAV8_9CHLR|nr:hypothetical protein [Ktedonospora formicarum]GHO49252.1 hypothetical protein KSX_74150 [Ktedonospora formicarum]